MSSGPLVQPIILRDYQSDLLARTATAFATHQRVLSVAPTGSGKSVMISAAAQQGLETLDGRIVVTAPRTELITQLSGTFERYGLAHSFIASGRPYDPRAKLFIAGIGSLDSRIQRGEINPLDYKLAIVDEASHSVAASWKRAIESMSRARVLGKTATPERLSGEGLGDVYGAMEVGPSPRDLIERRMLSRYVAYCPEQPDLRGVTKRGGDYAVGELAERMAKPGLTGNAVAQYRKRCDGALAIGFPVNVAHAVHCANAFNAARIPAAYVDGTMSMAQRASIVRAFADGHIRVLFSAELLSEGVDVAALAGRDVQVKAVLLLRPTKSVAMHLQQVGRALRPSLDGAPAHILDFAGNIMDANGDINLGFPDDDRAWSLKGRSKKAAEESEFLPAPPVRCTECLTAHRRPAPDNCSVCGHTLVAAPVIPKPKPGELAAIKAEEARQRAAQKAVDAEVKVDLQALADAVAAAAAEAKTRELRACKTFEGLEAFGKKHRHKPLWAIAYWSHMKSNKRAGYTGNGKKREIRQSVN